MKELAGKFTRTQWTLIALVLLIGLALRWVGLGDRPLHHDESLHAMYGKYFYTAPDHLFYKYDPMLHGPLLYHLLPHVYDLIGMGQAQVRALMALLGSLFMFLPFVFHRDLRPRALAFMIAAVSLSPSLIYWSRFLREDFLMLACQAGLLLACLRLRGAWRIGAGTFALLFAFCVKENAFINLALFLGFLIFDAALKAVQWAPGQAMAKDLLERIKSHRWALGLGLTAFALTFCHFYSAGFRYPQGILHNMFNEGLTYWLGQHHQERIPGPFSYQGLVLAWYDFPIFLLVLAHVVHFYNGADRPVRWGLAGTLLLALGARWLPDQVVLTLYDLLKLKIPLDLLLFAFMIYHSLALTTHYLRRGEGTLAFFGYMFWSSFFTYSFVGEKVPWLAVYPLVTGLIFLALESERWSWWSKPAGRFALGTWFLAFLALFELRIALKVNFSQAGADNQLISQVQTTQAFEHHALRVQDEMNYPRGPYGPKVLVLKSATWPASWYFYGVPGFHHENSKGRRQLTDFDVIFADLHDPEMDMALTPGFDRAIVSLRTWWTPEYNSMDLMNFFIYAVTHVQWNPPDGLNVAIYYKKR